MSTAAAIMSPTIKKRVKRNQRGCTNRHMRRVGTSGGASTILAMTSGQKIFGGMVFLRGVFGCIMPAFYLVVTGVATSFFIERLRYDVVREYSP